MGIKMCKQNLVRTRIGRCVKIKPPHIVRLQRPRVRLYYMLMSKHVPLPYPKEKRVCAYVRVCVHDNVKQFHSSKSGFFDTNCTEDNFK
jgi:hypothetical protein